jgi:hypothetical protein
MPENEIRLARAAACPSPETELDAELKTLAAFFASKISQEGPRRRGAIFDNNRVLQEEQAIFMA